MQRLLRVPGTPPSPARSPRRWAPLVVLAAVLALTACGGTDDDTATVGPTVTATTAPPEAPAEPAEADVTEDDAEVVNITVAGGEVSGVEPRTQIAVGTRVRLSITTDAADEVHVHGYELTQRLAAGETASLEFVADRPGIFEVELHDTQLVLTRLQVQ
jgi:hypothetical protein